MAVFLKIYGLTFFSVSFDLFREPFHLHVQKGNKLCKFWIYKNGSFELAKSTGFKNTELAKIEATLAENITFIIAKYETYCHENRLTPNYKIKRKA